MGRSEELFERAVKKFRAASTVRSERMVQSEWLRDLSNVQMAVTFMM